jgi:hypothetical protein
VRGPAFSGPFLPQATLHRGTFASGSAELDTDSADDSDSPVPTPPQYVGPYGDPEVTALPPPLDFEEPWETRPRGDGLGDGSLEGGIGGLTVMQIPLSLLAETSPTEICCCNSEAAGETDGSAGSEQTNGVLTRPVGAEDGSGAYLDESTAIPEQSGASASTPSENRSNSDTGVNIGAALVWIGY